MSDDERRVRAQDVIASALQALRRSVYICAPAKVVKVDSAQKRVDCQILVKRVYTDEEGERKAASWPIVPGVPVQFFGSGSFCVVVSIHDGSDASSEATTGMLMFSHLSLDKWLTGDGGEVDPELDHTNGLHDAVFIPGLRPFGNPWANMPAGGANAGISIGNDDDASNRILIRRTGLATAIELGAGATKRAARGGDAISASSPLITWAEWVESTLLAGFGAAPPTPFVSGAGDLGGLGSIFDETCSSVVFIID